MKLFRFTCGHVGRENESNSSRCKVRTFIRFAEVRDARVEDVDKTCPGCPGGEKR